MCSLSTCYLFYAVSQVQVVLIRGEDSRGLSSVPVVRQRPPALRRRSGKRILLLIVRMRLVISCQVMRMLNWSRIGARG